MTSIVDKNGCYGGVMSVENGLFGATLEILERADDPRRDPIGTIRGGGLYLRLREGIDSHADWWGVQERRWVGPGTPGTVPITGAMPGTPAARAQQDEESLS